MPFVIIAKVFLLCVTSYMQWTSYEARERCQETSAVNHVYLFSLHDLFVTGGLHTFQTKICDILLLIYSRD